MHSYMSMEFNERHLSRGDFHGVHFRVDNNRPDKVIHGDFVNNIPKKVLSHFTLL